MSQRDSVPSRSERGKMLGVRHYWKSCCRWCPGKPGDRERRKAKRSERHQWKQDVR